MARANTALSKDISLEEFRRRNAAVKDRVAGILEGREVPQIEFVAFDEAGEQFRYCVPLMMNKRIEAQENLEVRLVEHSEEETLLLCEATESLLMPRHYHHESEYVYILEGQMRDNVSGDIFSIGGSAHFPRKCLHEPEFLLPTRYLLVFRPGLPTKEL